MCVIVLDKQLAVRVTMCGCVCERMVVCGSVAGCVAVCVTVCD